MKEIRFSDYKSRKIRHLVNQTAESTKYFDKWRVMIVVANIPFICGQFYRLVNCRMFRQVRPATPRSAAKSRPGIMATFEEVGFLSAELDQWKHAVQEAYADAFGYAYRANG